MAGKPPMPKVPDKADDREQSERFMETAQVHEADESREALHRAFKKLGGRGAQTETTSTPPPKRR